MGADNFISLREALQEAVRKKYGKDYYLDEFSKTEAILGKSTPMSKTVGPYESKSWAVKYSIAGDKITFSGSLAAVKRITGYERAEDTAKEELDTKVAETEKAPEETKH
jgi:hypothetical protein